MPMTRDIPESTAYETDGILSEAVDRYALAWDQEQWNISAAIDDLRFMAGEQWPNEVANERRRDGRPMLTANQLPQFVNQVTGDIRLNTPAIKVRPAGSKATKDIAEVFTGLIRNIEGQSQAQDVYVNAAVSACRCGWGVFEIVTEYADDDTFEQDIRIKYEPNPLGVMFDPNAREADRSDANWAFRIVRMTYEEFKKLYPDASTTTWDQAKPLNTGVIWFDAREMAVAEYWKKVPVKKTICQLRDGMVVEKSRDKPYAVQDIVFEREVETHKVLKWILSGAEILEGPFEWAGKYIPLIPVVGEEVNVGDRTVRHGLVRFAKDSQRMYNYHITTATEVHALAPKAPFILTVNQVKGQEKMWRSANRRNLPYLLFTPDPQHPGAPQRSSPSTDITSSVALAESAVQDLYRTTGIYPSSLGAKSNEQSGKAIMARQRESDVGTYVYVDNLSRSIAYCGRQLVDLIPKIYDTEREVRILEADGTEDMVTINQISIAENTINNDITVGKYDVVVDTGPSFTTRRQEASQAMMEFVRGAPDVAPVVMDLIAKAQDWPYADEFTERLKRQLPPGLDDEVDAERMQRQGPPQPDPIQEAMVMQAQGDAQYSMAKAGQAQADAMAKQIQVRTQAAKTQAETEGVELDNAGKSLELAAATGGLGDLVRQLVMQEVQRALMPPRQ